MQVQGYCDPRFAKVRDLFAENWDLFDEVGASIAATVDGKPIFDLWGGWADAARSRPWQGDTIVMVASVTKGLTGLLGNMLIDRGLLDPEAPVARYWPEFAAAGKQDLPVKYLFNHTAGLPDLPPGTVATEWDAVVQGLAEAAPLWEPGTAHAYHSITMGHLIGELIRRVTGHTVGALLRSEVCEPLGGAEAWIGFGAERDGQVADMVGDVRPDWQTLDWRRNEVPAASGHANARGLARIFAPLALGGEIDGVRLIGEQTLKDATADYVTGRWFGWTDDFVRQVGVPLGVFDVRFARGFAMANDFAWMGPNPEAFGSGGSGGALAFADPVARVSFGYAQNAHIGQGHQKDSRSGRVIQAIYEAL